MRVRREVKGIKESLEEKRNKQDLDIEGKYTATKVAGND
jgi:hypothetical protein